MRAIDTNVVVRLIARDDAASEVIARKLLEGSFLLVPTVLLENEWVLRAVYRMPRPDICRALRILLGHENAVVANETSVAHALSAYNSGSDFADALHMELAAEAGATSFASFDRGAASGAVPVESLSATTR